MDLSLDQNTYTLTFEIEEELPLGLWTALVKWRAGYKCQHCGNKLNLSGRSNLISHHIRATSDGGRTVLANGECLCTACHGKLNSLTKIPVMSPYHAEYQSLRSLIKQAGGDQYDNQS